MGEFDLPALAGNEFFGKVGNTGAGFDSGGDVVAERGDNAEDLTEKGCASFHTNLLIAWQFLLLPRLRKNCYDSTRFSPL